MIPWKIFRFANDPKQHYGARSPVLGHQNGKPGAYSEKQSWWPVDAVRLAQLILTILPSPNLVEFGKRSIKFVIEEPHRRHGCFISNAFTMGAAALESNSKSIAAR
jgi:hypothetical protein